MIFELGASNDSAEVSRPTIDELKQSTLAQIAHYVSTSGQILNIRDVSAWLKVDQVNGQPDLARNILCMPIYNGQKSVIGVAQLINKVSNFDLYTYTLSEIIGKYEMLNDII